MPGPDAHWKEEVERPWAARMERAGRFLLYSLAALLPGRKPEGPFDIRRVRSILLVKEPYRMGDLLQATPTLRALKAQLPGVRLGLVVQDRNAPLFRHNPHLDELFVYAKREFNARPWRVLPFLKEIRARRFDLAVTLETQRTHLTNDLIAFLSGATWRLRYAGDALGHPGSDAFYNLSAPFDPSARHETEMNFGVFKPCGLSLEDRGLLLRVSTEDERAGRKVLDDLGLSQRSFVIIHPGSYKLNNRWPLENFLKVGGKLKEAGQAVLFTLGPSEEEWRGEIESAGFRTLSGLALMRMAAVFSLAGKVLCNDTGMMHVAAGFGTPAVALFGETDPERWAPPGGLVQVLRAPEGRLENLSVETVVRALAAQ